MTAKEEQAYIRGSTAAWRSILGQALMQLGIDDPKAKQARWVAERLDTIAVLRDLCGEHGDNDWPDNLYLADIIEKHLGKHLG
jgi:hypothetical protein